MAREESRATSSNDDNDHSPVRAVQRALDVLNCFADEPAKLTLSEVARSTGLPVSTVSRLLATLENAGFLRRSARAYACGPRLIQISLNGLRNLPIYEIAERHLARLTEITGESSYLGIWGDNGRIIYVRQCLSSKSIRHVAWLGRTIPVQGTAIGSAITGNVGAQGFAATRRTLEADVTAIAAPIYGPDGSIAAAINLTGPTYRIKDDDIRRYGLAVVAEAGAISKEIGGIAPL